MEKTSRQIIYKEKENIQNAIKLMRCSATSAQRQIYTKLQKTEKISNHLVDLDTLWNQKKQRRQNTKLMERVKQEQ